MDFSKLKIDKTYTFKVRRNNAGTKPDAMYRGRFKGVVDMNGSKFVQVSRPNTKFDDHLPAGFVTEARK